MTEGPVGSAGPPGSPGSTGSPARTGLGLAVDVLGAGVLFLPWTAAAAYGAPTALWGWACQLLAGALLVAALTGVSTAPGARDGATALIAGALGGTYGRAVRVCYLLGITAGQAVLALAAAGFLGQPLGLAHSRSGVGWLAAGVLAAGVLLTPVRRAVPKPVLFGLLLPALAAAVWIAAHAHGGAGDGAGGGAHGAGGAVGLGGVGGAAALQFFAVVGWESAARAAARAPAATGVRHRLGPLSAVPVVGMVYGAVLAATPHLAAVRTAGALPLPDLGGGVAARTVALVLGAGTAYFCVRNVRTAALLADGLRCEPGELAGRGERRGCAAVPVPAAALVGAVAAAGAALVLAGRLTPAHVLAVPNSMACAVFVTAAVAATCASRGSRRALALLAAAAQLALAPYVGAAVLLPGAVLAAAAVRHLLVRPRRTGTAHGVFEDTV